MDWRNMTDKEVEEVLRLHNWEDGRNLPCKCDGCVWSFREWAERFGDEFPRKRWSK